MARTDPPEIDGSIEPPLRRFDALAPLTDSQIETLAAVAEREDVPSGRVVFEERSEGTDVLLIGGGRFELRRDTPFGVQKVATLAAGDLCGEISMLDGNPRSATVVATEEGHLWRFGAEGVAALIGRDPELELTLLRAFCRSLAGKIRQANQVMTEIMAGDGDADQDRTGARGQRDALDEEAKRRILREQGMFTQELVQLARFLEAERFSAGDPIFVEGELGDTLYIVADGKVRISRRIPGMGEEALAILERGEVFGEMAWIDSSPRSADAVAHSGGCTVLGISRQLLDDAISAQAETGAQFLRLICHILCNRIRNRNDQLVAYRTMAWF